MKEKVNDRLKRFRKELHLTQESVAARLGIGKSALSMVENGHAALSARNRDLLIRAYGLNPAWLDEGTEPMLAGVPGEGAAEGNGAASPAPLPVPEGGTRHRQVIPLRETVTAGGLSPLLERPEEFAPEEYLQIPGLSRCDGAVRIHDDGMAPLLRRGDLALYRAADPEGEPFWGDMYLVGVEIGGEETVAVRYLRPGRREGFLELRGADPSLPGREVERKRIRALARVVATLRIGGGGL